jgi:hypothetical protein
VPLASSRWVLKLPLYAHPFVKVLARLEIHIQIWCGQ